MTRTVLSFALAVGCATLSTIAEPNNYQVVFKNTAPLEIPAKAAGFVQAASAKERDAATVAIVKSSIEVNATTAAAVVGAIARVAPDQAATAAGTAAAAQPKLAPAIAKAAAAAAPSKAQSIVYAVCKAVPGQFRTVALAVSQAAPNAGPEIIAGVVEAIPALKGYVEQSRANLVSSGRSLTVASVLDPAVAAPTELTPSAATAPVLASSTAPARTTFAAGDSRAPAERLTSPPPVIGPPYVHLTNNVPTETTPNNSGEVPPGGRNYSSP